MNKLTRDFISEDSREYTFKIGTMVASSLSGFICGFVVAGIIFAVVLAFKDLINI